MKEIRREIVIRRISLVMMMGKLDGALKLYGTCGGNTMEKSVLLSQLQHAYAVWCDDHIGKGKNCGQNRQCQRC